MRHLADIPRSLSVATVLAVLSSALTANTASAQSASDLVHRGEAIVTRDCIMCHAVGRGELGRSGEGPALSGVLGRLSEDALRHELATGITAGHPQMPRLRYDAGDIDAIMAYLQDIAGR